MIEVSGSTHHDRSQGLLAVKALSCTLCHQAKANMKCPRGIRRRISCDMSRCSCCTPNQVHCNPQWCCRLDPYPSRRVAGTCPLQHHISSSLDSHCYKRRPRTWKYMDLGCCTQSTKACPSTQSTSSIPPLSSPWMTLFGYVLSTRLVLGHDDKGAFSLQAAKSDRLHSRTGNEMEQLPYPQPFARCHPSTPLLSPGRDSRDAGVTLLLTRIEVVDESSLKPRHLSKNARRAVATHPFPDGVCRTQAGLDCSRRCVEKLVLVQGFPGLAESPQRTARSIDTEGDLRGCLSTHLRCVTSKHNNQPKSNFLRDPTNERTPRLGSVCPGSMRIHNLNKQGVTPRRYPIPRSSSHTPQWVASSQASAGSGSFFDHPLTSTLAAAKLPANRERSQGLTDRSFRPNAGQTSTQTPLPRGLYLPTHPLPRVGWSFRSTWHGVC